MKSRSPFLLAIVSFSLSAFLCLVLIEIVLRFLPVSSYISLEPVTASDPVLRIKPNIEQTYSAGWDFDAYNKGHVNAQGYVSDFDFEDHPGKPLIAVVGDSYIEARMVPFEQTIQQRLNTALGDKVDVYGVGIGGSPMSQYLIFAKMIRDKYHPDFLIVTVVENDFDESLPEYKNMPRFHYFVEDGKGDLKPSLIGEYHPSFLKELISRSAIIRYLYFNLNLSHSINKIMFALRAKGQAEGPVEEEVGEPQKVQKSKKAVDAFLKLLSEYAGLDRRKILIVVDAVRAPIYAGIKPKDNLYFNVMRQYLLTNARRAGYRTLDLQEVFERDYLEHQKSFEFKQDRHWNGYAHGVAAKAVLESGVLPKKLQNDRN